MTPADNLQLAVSPAGDEALKPGSQGSDPKRPSTLARTPVRVPLTQRRLARILLPLAAVVVITVLWEIAVKLFEVPYYLVPAPSQFLPRIVTSWDVLGPAAWTTGLEIALGFAVAVVVSIPLAMVFSSSSWLRSTFYPLVVIFQVVPKIALAPVLVVWFGVGLGSIVLLTFLLCFFPILANAMAGFMSLDERTLYLTRSMGAGRWQTFRYVRLPATLPFIFAGLEVAIVLAATGAIVGEFVGSTSGLGYTLHGATGVLDSGLVFADLFVLSVLGLLFYYVVVLVGWLVMPWSRRGKTA